MHYTDLVDMAETLGVSFSDPWGGVLKGVTITHGDRAALLFNVDRSLWKVRLPDGDIPGTRFRCLMRGLIYVLYGRRTSKTAEVYCEDYRLRIGCDARVTTLDLTGRTNNLELAMLLRATAARLEEL